MRRFSSLLTAGAIVLTLGVTVPARAQSIVFDPNNYAQNVLTAARALQQINNQITSLQNQAQMLINQAKNLAGLPYSSLQQLEQSVGDRALIVQNCRESPEDRIVWDVGHQTYPHKVLTGRRQRMTAAKWRRKRTGGGRASPAATAHW